MQLIGSDARNFFRGSPRPADLGRAAADRVRLEDSESLQHLAPLRPAGRGAAVIDLFDPNWRPQAAPDPTALFLRWRAHRTPGASEGEPLRVLTYNVGLLARSVPGRTFAVPHARERRRVLPERVLGDGADIVLLQEVWDPIDLEAFTRAALHHGYAWFSGGPARGGHGLLILVRAAAIARDAEQQFHTEFYREQRRVEWFPGPRVRRGFLGWSFVHARTGIRLVVADTHTTAFPPHADTRLAQARQLGLYLAAAPDDAVIIAGGDLNAGPHYPRDVYAAGRPIPGWWRDALMYPALLHYGGGLFDPHAIVHPHADVAAAAEITVAHEGHRERAFGDATFVPGRGRDVFTASDENSLYRQQYGGTEYPARIDHVLVRDRGGRVGVVDSRVCFRERIDVEGVGTIETSDHYAVTTDLRLT